MRRFQASTRGPSNPMQLKVFVHVVAFVEAQALKFMNAMLARDLLDLPATKVLTQSKVRRIFYENVLNLVSPSQFLL